MLIIIYIILLALGLKSTWIFVTNHLLAGSDNIGFTILLFVLLILIVGPIIGIINIVKYAISKLGKSKTIKIYK